jgi:hypothetical protein
MLAKPHALPCAERELAIGYWDCQGTAEKASFNVSGLKEEEEEAIVAKLLIFPSEYLTMSSGPSHECRYGNPSGTILFSIISMSSLRKGSQREREALVSSPFAGTYLTSGSQLSFNAKLADV